MSAMWGYFVSGVIALGALGQSRAQAISNPPFEELSMCLPFNVEIAKPTAAHAAYSVSVVGDQALVAVINARWASASTSFISFSPPISGALFLYAKNGSIPASSTPLQITVYIPQMTLRVVDVTRGTTVTLPKGFQMSSLSGSLNVPAGAVLYAPQVAIPGTTSLITEAHSPPYGDDGMIVWSNARSNEHLQAVSLIGPAQVIVNSTAEGVGYQRFATQPYGALLRHWVGSYANISTKADQGSISIYAKASLKDVYVFKSPCQTECPYRFFMCTFDGGCTNLTSAESLSYDYYQTFPMPIPGTPATFTACPVGVPSFTCSAGVTNQVC